MSERHQLRPRGRPRGVEEQRDIVLLRQPGGGWSDGEAVDRGSCPRGLRGNETEHGDAERSATATAGPVSSRATRIALAPMSVR